MAIKRWATPTVDNEMAKILADECGISELTAAVLVARNHTTYEDAMRFLTKAEEISSPFDLKDMAKAVKRLHDAIANFEKVTIYGDYDCDGVTATTVLYTYLSSVGANVSYYIPTREGEGYGLNKAALKEIADSGTTLVITVDNGISAVLETDYANEIGLTLIITDHHQPSDILPNAYAVIDPYRKDDLSGFKPLAGVFVAFKLVCALEDGEYQSSLEYFSDLVALGTIGDVVPLIGENRTIVKHGLNALKYSENYGVNALMQVAGIDSANVTAQTAAFMLVPRINAAGRMGRADLAVSLFLSEDGESATEKAEELNSLNTQRQGLEASIITDIENQIDENPQMLSHKVLMIKGENWHGGVLGIVCSKLVERFGKPVLLMNTEIDNEYGEVLKGSGRSLSEFHLFKALSSCSSNLIRFGGHKLAAGFSLKCENFDAFCNAMDSYCDEFFDTMPPAVLQFDKVVTADELTIEQLEQLSFLEPFGCQNEPPLFLLKNATLTGVTSLSNDKHQRLTLTANGKNQSYSLTALLFKTTTEQFPFSVGNILDLAVNAEINEYNQKRSVSLKVKDLRMAGFSQDKFFAAENAARKLLAKEEVSQKVLSCSIPTRDETAVVYRFLKANNGYNKELPTLYMNLPDKNINFCKLLMILQILSEGNLIEYQPHKAKISVCEATQKVDLKKTPLMQQLTAAIT